MAKLIQCIDCEMEFDPLSPAKRRAGGRLHHCPDCAVEVAVRYAGVQAADGKQAQAAILKFQSESDKRAYLAFWQNNIGMHKGKSCTLGKHLSTTPKIAFETISSIQPTNHKGRA